MRFPRESAKLSGVLSYLHNPAAAEQDDDGGEDCDLFSMPTTAEISKTVKELIQRLEDCNDDSVTDIDSVADSQDSQVVQQTAASNSKTLSVKEEMDLAILTSTCKSVINSSNSTSHEQIKIIRQEMTLFENEGNRDRHLQFAYDYIMSVPPTV